MKVLSLFSGVGGFDLGLENAGMETIALCEWDNKAAHILRRHWPNIPIYGDVSELTATQLLADGVLPDLVAFGSPCQDLSVAGKRAGLAGERSGLFHEATRIIRELRTLTNATLPRWVIWENVVGALNSNRGADFGAVLDAMGDLGAYFSEWAVLDAQNYGVAQRRRRIFLVSCLDPATARVCPDPLLPVGAGGPRDLAPLRAAWKDTSRRAPRRARGGGTVVIRQREGKPGGGKGPLISEDMSLTLATANDQTPIHPIGFSHTQGLDAQPSEEAFPTLRREGSGHAVAYADTVETWWDGGDTADTLTVSSNEQRMPDKGRLQMVVGTLAARDYKGVGNQYVAEGKLQVIGSVVRRLTPLECERLMGWPDDWTRWDADGNEQADTHRYKQIGNGVASPVAEWVGREIIAADVRRPR